MTLFTTSDNNWGQPGKWYVHPTPGLGTHTTLTAAYNSSASGDTIYLAPGFTYSDSFNITKNLQITSLYKSLGSPAPILSGNINCNAGSTTNSFSNMTITGFLGLNSGTLNIDNVFFTGTSFFLTNGNPSGTFNVNNCVFTATGSSGYIGTSQSGIYNFTYCNFNTNTTTTTINTGAIATFKYCTLNAVFSTAGSGVINVYNCESDSLGNTTFLTLAGTGTSLITNSYVASGTAAAISIGTGTTLNVSQLVLNSTNANPITGAGTLNYVDIGQIGTAGVFNTTNTNLKTLSGGYYQGINTATSPPAGSIGESISASVARASATVINNNSATTITSISLTPGIWDISAMGCLIGTLTGTQWAVSITTTTNTQGTPGTTEVSTPTVSTVGSDSCLSIGKVRLTFGTTTSVFVTGFALFSVGTATQYGSVIATRVA
jgi:hypothetical protein